MISGSYIASGVIDNPNFYTQYNLAKGAVSIFGTYWTQQLEQGKVVEKYFSLDFSLNREEDLAVIAAMEAYCKAQYGQTCMEFLNEQRKEGGFRLLPNPQSGGEGIPGRPSFDHLIKSVATRAAETANQGAARAPVSPSLQSRG